MIYSLIPARMGSERLPNKSSFKFMLGDKPLIAYTIEAVKNAGITPYVFTNEYNSGSSVSDWWYGADILFRPEEVSKPETTMKKTVKSFIDIMRIEQDDTILLTYLTCPFRTAEHIKGAIDLFETGKFNSLQTITPVDYRPYGLMKQYRNSNIYACTQDQKDYYQKQNTPILYKANGAIYIFKVSQLDRLNNQMLNRSEDTTRGYILDSIEGLDIDTRADLMLAESILQRKDEMEQINEHSLNQLPYQRRREAECDTNWTWTDSGNYEIIGT